MLTLPPNHHGTRRDDRLVQDAKHQELVALGYANLASSELQQAVEEARLHPSKFASWMVRKMDAAREKHLKDAATATAEAMIFASIAKIMSKNQTEDVEAEPKD